MKFENGDEFVKNLVIEYCPSPTISSTVRLDTYYKKAHSMFYEALDSVKQGKDARAYIALMRYAQFVAALTKHSNYSAKQFEKERNANKRRLNNAITKLEELKPKIIKMYNDKIQKEKEEELQSKSIPNDTNPSKVIEPKQSIESVAVDPSTTDTKIEPSQNAETKTEETLNKNPETIVSKDDNDNDEIPNIDMPPAPPQNIRELHKKTAKYGRKRRKSKQFGFRKKENFAIKIQSEDGEEKELHDDEAQKEKKKDGVLSVGWNSKDDKIKKKVRKIKRKQKRTTYDGWNVSDLCYINGKQYMIKKIHFDTKPPTLTVALKSDEERKFVTEFDLISREEPLNINKPKNTQAQNATKMSDNSSNKQMYNNNNNNDVINQRPIFMNDDNGNNATPNTMKYMNSNHTEAVNTANAYNNTRAPNYMNKQQIEKKVNSNDDKNEHISSMNKSINQRPIYMNNTQGHNVNYRKNPSDNSHMMNNIHMNNMNKPQKQNTMNNNNNIAQRSIHRNNNNHQNSNQRPMYSNNNNTNVNHRTNPMNNNMNMNKMNHQQPKYRNNNNGNMNQMSNTYNNAQTQKYTNNQQTPKNIHNYSTHNNNQQPMYMNNNAQNRNNANHNMNNQRQMYGNNNMKGGYMNHRNIKQLPPKPQNLHNKKPQVNNTQYVGFKPPQPNHRNHPKKQLPSKQPQKQLPKKAVEQNNETKNVWDINENAEDDSDDEDYKKNRVLASYKKRRSSINYDNDASDEQRVRRGSVFDESSSDDDDAGNGTGRRLSVDISNVPIAAVSAHVNFN